jgi:hypothetical protein
MATPITGTGRRAGRPVDAHEALAVALQEADDCGAAPRVAPVRTPVGDGDLGALNGDSHR